MAKIKEFFAKNWGWIKYVTIIPIVLIALARILKWYVNLLVKDNDKTDESLHKADVSLRQDNSKISSDEKKALDSERQKKDTLLESIDRGNPKPVDVVNEMISGSVKVDEERKS